jgi:nucleotide-binding universal stress UspA family protein
MMMTTTVDDRRRRPVLVGVDGSVSARGALAWAATEAASRHCPLRIVHAFSWPTIGTALDMGFGVDSNLGLQSAAEWILAEAGTYARDLAPDVKTVASLLVGPAAPTLLSEAHDAELVVVGGRGTGGFRGLLMGSVSATVAAHAPCPVVVVHPHGDGTAFRASPTGRIVVGVDGSDISAAALRFAFRQAAYRRIGITAVHAARTNRPHPSLRVPPEIADQVERQLFAEAMETKRVLVPGIDVRTKVVYDHPAQALINASADAELVVVGSRGRGGFAGMLLGSVSQSVLQHATCPVAVVRPHRSPTTGEPSATRRLPLTATAPDELSDLKERS